MPEEHESAAAAWLDNPGTRREMEIISDRFPNWDQYQVTSIVLLMELMVALNIYGSPTILTLTDDPDDDDDDKEEWQK